MRSITRRISHHAKQAASMLSPRSVADRVSHRRLISHFCENMGLVYFGYVSQQTDEHRLVRGFTVSPHQRDNHYCIGSYEGYDVILVERAVTRQLPNGTSKSHSWLIFQIDLKMSGDLPHVFIGTHLQTAGTYSALFTASHNLRPVPLGTFGTHTPEFVNNYTIYTTPSQYLEVERMFSTEITRAIGQHFRPLSVEIVDQCVYIYADNQRLTPQLLTAMLKNGVWLARQIDQQT